MINKQSIYYWFFFPLLALLSAGSLTSCIYDSVLEEEDTSGKSTLSITMRGITTTDPSTSGGSYDDYVKTLRVIGFDASGSVVCNELHEGTDFAIINDALNITQTMEDTFQGGVCDFYFIANEDGYSVYDSQDRLSEFLEGENFTKNALDSCVIAFDVSKLDTNYPILMSATSSSQLIKPGENVMGTVYLVRCIAALQLVVKTPISGVTLSNVSLTGSYPVSFSLFNIDSQNVSPMDIIPDDTYLSQIAISEEEKMDDIVYSGRIFFPEQLIGNILAAYSFSINNEPFTLKVVDDDRLIERNNCYKTIATYDYEDSQVELSYEVTSWTNVEVNIPEFE